MLKRLVVDSSSLFALERAHLVQYLPKIGGVIIVPPAVQDEIKQGTTEMLLNYVTIIPLRGGTLKKSKHLEHLGIGRGEAHCCALAAYLKFGFMIADDQRFMRQRLFCNDALLKEIKVIVFSFFLHEFYKRKLIQDIWAHFEVVIRANNWERSAVQAENFIFLKERGY